MPLLPPHYLDTVVAIGVGPDEPTRQWIGTGFFYGLATGEEDAEGNSLYSVFLITNKHVFADFKEVWVRLNAADMALPSKEYRVELAAKNGRKLWVGHPDSDADVAAVLVNAGFLTQEERRFSFFPEDVNVLTADKLGQVSTAEGDGVFMLGFPMGMLDRTRPYAICRSGSIARIGDVRNGHGKEILIDGLVFPGNSGGPVVTRPEIVSVGGLEPFGKSSLLGVVASYVPYQEVARSDQTGRPRMVFEENSGLTSVVPAECIRETVMLAKKRIKNRTAQRRFQLKRKQQEADVTESQVSP